MRSFSAALFVGCISGTFKSSAADDGAMYEGEVAYGYAEFRTAFGQCQQWCVSEYNSGQFTHEEVCRFSKCKGCTFADGSNCIEDAQPVTPVEAPPPANSDGRASEPASDVCLQWCTIQYKAGEQTLDTF
eukprot:gene32021-18891_t